MASRLLSTVVICMLLAGCAAIEIDPSPKMPDLRVKQEARQAAEAPTSATTFRRVPGGVPLTSNLAPSTGPLNITLQSGIVLTLANNRALLVDEFNPAIRKTFEEVQRAAFDPTLSADIAYNSVRTTRFSPGFVSATGVINPPTQTITTARQTNGSVALNEFLPTGTNIGLNFSTSRINGATPEYTSRGGLTISQQILRGGGINAVEVNLVALHQAQIDTLSSQYELRGFTESTVASLEQAYWNYLYANRQVKILEDAVKVANDQLSATMQRIQVGNLAASERFAAQAEVASRQEALINGRSLQETTALALLRLLSPPNGSLAPREINLLSEPLLPAHPYDSVDTEIELGLRMRPDLNQARLLFKRDQLDIVQTKNGLLPNLQLFATLGKTGFAQSFDDSVSNIDDSKNHDLALEAQFSYPLGNRAARANYRRALLNNDQQLEAIRNMEQLVEQDVRGQVIEVNRVGEQVDATAVTRQLQQETLRVEQEKFRVGRSTQLLVAQAERDLLTAQINELQAFVSYIEAVTTLYRLDGTLLERRGVLCPGNGPVAMPAKPKL